MKMSQLILALVCLLVVTGCGRQGDGPIRNEGEAANDVAGGGPTETAHVHPSHGPHQGELIELGQEDYHAELVHDESGVSLYLLDASAKKPVEVEAETLVLNLKHEGVVKGFSLTAKSDLDASSGMSSQFVSTEEELSAWLDAGAQGAVSVEIEGRSYTGEVKHDHNHGPDSGHGHEHGKGEAHEHGDGHSHGKGDEHDHGDHDHQHG